MKAIRSIRIENDVWEKLKDVARRDQRTVSNVINVALADFLKMDFEREIDPRRRRPLARS